MDRRNFWYGSVWEVGENMDREMCEKLILKKLEEIKEIYKEYNPDGEYLAMAIVGGWISVNNEYFDKDEEKPINFYKGE